MLKEIKGFIVGFVASAVLITGMQAMGATSLLQTITVAVGGISLYVDGKLVQPLDANGTPVEPMIYNGTTYLPLRALSNALTNNSKEVLWDGDKNTIYVGTVPMAPQVSLDTLKPYKTGHDTYNANKRGDLAYSFYKPEKNKFNLLDKEYTFTNGYVGKGNFSDTNGFFNSVDYILDSKYSKLKANFVIPYTNIESKVEGKVNFYNVSPTGTETLIKSIPAKATDKPVAVECDLLGVNYLRLQVASSNIDSEALLYDIVLETAK